MGDPDDTMRIKYSPKMRLFDDGQNKLGSSRFSYATAKALRGTSVSRRKDGLLPTKLNNHLKST